MAVGPGHQGLNQATLFMQLRGELVVFTPAQKTEDA